jgi:glutathione S-transferase
MLNLYYKESCPFCQRVLQMAENLGVTFELKDIESDDAIAAELISLGGKRQVPYLVDTDKGTAMYESGDIIDYIRDNYAGTAAADKPRIHQAGPDATCVACEG